MNVYTLPDPLRAGIKQFVQWSAQQLRAEEEATKINQPLYHYTNAAGLHGIIDSQKLWFTSYLHLNDPSELTQGMNVAHRVLKETSEDAGDELVKTFCRLVDDLFQHWNFADLFGFYITSLSRADDDLGQWRAYADNGRGFALGLAPHLFGVEYRPPSEPSDHFILPVAYGNDASHRYRTAIEAAVNAIRANRPHLHEERISWLFMRELADQLISGQLIGLSLSVKHEAYSNEREVRLVILGVREQLKGDVKMRIRGSELVPYIASALPLRDKDGIVDIVIGPAAGPTAKDAVYRLLEYFGIDPADRVRVSGIPYRAF